MFPAKVWLYLLHPVWITLACVIVLLVLFRLTGLWRRHRYWIVALLFAVFAIDAVIALPRVLYSYSLSTHPVVARKIALPRQLVLLDVQCSAECHELLISGALEEAIVVQPSRSPYGNDTSVSGYRAGWVNPGDCPYERQRAVGFAIQLLKTGYCPLSYPAEMPSSGVFIVREVTIVRSAERAKAFKPVHLVNGPPGRVIEFAGVEVQTRSAVDIEVLASSYKYFGPGILGLPPLIGCWERPDNVIWIMPPGDTGCGFWRWFTWGGDDKAKAEPDWVYKSAFAPPDRLIAPPQRPSLSSPTPAEALELLTNAQPIDDYLPGLRDLLLDGSNSDRALADIVVRLAKRGNLEGSLVALLASNRPSALVGLAQRLDPVPFSFVKPDLVLTEMEKSPAVREVFADAMLVSLAANWRPPENIDRFLQLMDANQPGWLCGQLGRFNGPNGILKARESRATKNMIEAMPPFVPLIVRRTAQTCPVATAELLREQVSSVRPETQSAAAELAGRSVPGFVSTLAVQAVVNLAEAKIPPQYKNEQRRHTETHVALLRIAALSCDVLAEDVEIYIKRRIEQARPPSEPLNQMLERIRAGQAGEFCQN